MVRYGYFFIDPRTCEEVLYVPRSFEVRYSESRKQQYLVNFNINKLDGYASADSKNPDLIDWGAKTGFIWEIEIEKGNLELISDLCWEGDEKKAKEVAELFFQMISSDLKKNFENYEKWLEEQADGDAGEGWKDS